MKSDLPVNPKQVYGDKKPGLHINPLSAQIAQWEAHFDGALKYGEVNWRERPVEAMTYIDAALRHLRLFENGEVYARDTQVHNLGAVMACCAILIDSMLHGTMVDNRTPSKASCDLLHTRGEEMVKVLRNAQFYRENPSVPATPDPIKDIPEDATEVPGTGERRCNRSGFCDCNYAPDCKYNFGQKVYDV